VDRRKNTLKKGLDYISKRGKILRIKEKELYETFEANDIDANEIATAFASRDSRNIENLIGRHLNDVTEEIHSEYDDRNSIHANIRNGFGELLIPGSSIKGAIRSALYGELHRKKLFP
jgi:CRISPR/Cas system CSM-associated protein Csm5 (group 7 of RAMP superfamily)